MEKVIECDCGWSCRGTDDELIAACAAHGREAHGMNLTPEQILAVARPVDDDEQAPAR